MDLSRYVTASPAEGGVRLTPRVRFRDVMGTYIDPKDNVARSREVDDGLVTGAVRAATSAVNAGNQIAGQQDDEYPPQLVKDANGNSSIRQTIFTFGPMARGQSYAFQEMDNGLVAVCLTSPASDYPGNGGTPTAAGTSDRRSAYLANSYGRNSEASKLATMNSANKRYFGR